MKTARRQGKVIHIPTFPEAEAVHVLHGVFQQWYEWLANGSPQHVYDDLERALGRR